MEYLTIIQTGALGSQGQVTDVGLVRDGVKLAEVRRSQEDYQGSGEIREDPQHLAHVPLNSNSNIMININSNYLPYKRED